MKFEIDLNELTTDQRAHVAAFVTNWPTYSEVSNQLKEILDAPENEEFKMAKRAGGIAGARNLSEEQRLDAEQKEELSAADECRKIGSQIASDNLNVIFGAPDITKEMGQLIEERKALISDIMHNTVPLDKEGLPWDSRIHASTKTFIADGSWKLRRGVDPISVEMIKHQLKELMAVPTVYSQGVVSPDKVPFAPVLDSDVGLLPTQPAPVLPRLTSVGYVPVPPTPVIIPQLAEVTVNVGVPPAPKSHYLIDQQPVDTPIPSNVPATVTLTDLIGRMSKAIVENRLTQANVTEICVKHGVSEFHLLSNRPDLLPLIDADVKAMGV